MAEKKKVVITLQRVYYKQIEFEIETDVFEGLTDEEIAVQIIEGNFDDSEVDNLFGEASLDGGEEGEECRYDIYDENGKLTYGGHL